MELGEFSKDEILDHLNNIKLRRCEDEARLNDLQKTREHLMSLANAKLKLDELYARVVDNLEHATLEIKALALDALDIKVFSRGIDDVEIQGIIPLELALSTTEQTSGRSKHHRKLNVLISAEIRDHKVAGQTLLLA